MTRTRLLTYTGLCVWFGALAHAWYVNVDEGVTLPALVNTVLAVGALAAVLVMGRRDIRRGVIRSDDD